MRDALEQDAPVVKVIATGISLVVGLSDNMQITFQSGFEGDETDDVVNARVDRLVRIAERQKAVAAIDRLETDLVGQKEKLAQYRLDYDTIDLSTNQIIAQREIEFDERIALRDSERKVFADEIDEKIAAIQERRDAEYKAGLDEFTLGGRGGAYHPRGARKQALERMEHALIDAAGNREAALADFDRVYEERLDTAKAELDKARQERGESLRAVQMSIDRYVSAVENTQALLDKAREMKGT